MKRNKRLLAILLCLALIASLSVAAYAVSISVFTKVSNGCRCSGTAELTNERGKATLTAVKMPGTQVMPDEMYTAIAEVKLFSASGEVLASGMSTGNLSATAVCTKSGTTTTDHAKSRYTFQDEVLGIYKLEFSGTAMPVSTY